MSTMLNDPRLIKNESGGIIGQIRNRLSRSDLGALPVIIGLVLIWAIFYWQNDKFLTALNISNLMVQIAAMGTISAGIVLILLLGEVDLSVGATSGFAAAIMAVLNVKLELPGAVAVLAGLAVGLTIGLVQGTWITKLKVPSFIVTLAGLLGWQGALIYTLGNTGTVNLRNEFILSLAGTYFSTTVGWGVAFFFVAIYVGSQLWERQRRVAAGLTAVSMQELLVRFVVVGGLVVGLIAILNSHRGLPSALVFFLGIVMVLDWITQRTVFGRHIYAVGGNMEAARRASINVDMIRISVFAISSTLAALGGILGASRLLAVNQSSGGGDLLLNAIAAAVIGGTSLFGGRGNVWSAVLGALVIGSISNGMDLLALPSATKFMITGGVLLVAVTIDAVARSRREASGR